MGFRTDIEGLRGVAILLVVLFHVEVAGFEGGFVGVDVFFVISGFLISKQLFSETSTSGRVRLLDFWARRLRRLTPLLFFTILATLVSSLVVYSPLAWRSIAVDAMTATIYLSNVHFALDGVQYFTSAPSPYLQTWSLGVEEQFYIGWPILFLVVALVAGRRRDSFRGPLVVGVAAASVASFAVGVLLTDRGTPWAFFGAPARAWEFGAGALLFLVTTRLRHSRQWTPHVVGVAGLALVVVAVTRFDDLTPFPGTAALVPVAATVCLILAGSFSTNWIGRALSVRPLRSIGRVSYGWYLLHWPALVLVPDALDRHDVTTRLLSVLGALLLAYAATRFVEQPVRDAPGLRATGRVYASAAIATVLLIAGGGVVIGWAERELRDPYLATLEKTRDDRVLAGSGDCTPEEFGDGLRACVYGDVDGDLSVMLVGDSQAAQWSSAVEMLAREDGLRLVVLTRGGCPAYDVSVRNRFGSTSSGCEELRGYTDSMLTTFRPDVVLTANADYSGDLLSPDGDVLDESAAAQSYRQARERFAERVAASGAGLAVVESIPIQPVDPVECLAKNRDPEGCSAPVDEVVPFVEEVTAAERQALASVAEFAMMPVVPLVCDSSRCLVEKDGMVVYSDARHLARGFTELQVDDLRRLVADAVTLRTG